MSMRWRIRGWALHVGNSVLCLCSAWVRVVRSTSNCSVSQEKQFIIFMGIFWLSWKLILRSWLCRREVKDRLKKGGSFSYLQVGFRKHNCGNVLIAVLLLRGAFCEAKHTTNWRVLLPVTKLLLELVFHFKRNSEKPTFGRISSQPLYSPYAVNF